MTTILSTTDYDQFKKIRGNRPLGSIDRLLKSIKYRNMLKHHPIHVDSHMYIIDGQHRLECARQLQIPIYYTIDHSASKHDIHHINTASRNWAVIDFVNLYKEEGRVEYRFLAKCIDKYGFDISFISITSLSQIDTATPERTKTGKKKQDSIITSVKKGDIAFKKDFDEVVLERKYSQIKEILDYCREKLMTTGGFDHIRRGLFALVSMEEYDHKHMMKKIETFPENMINIFKFKDRREIRKHLLAKLYYYKMKQVPHGIREEIGRE